MNARNSKCYRAHEIGLKKKDRENINSEDKRFFEEHFKDCEDCRLDTDIAEVLKLEGLAADKEATTDELLKRRMMDEAIRQAASTDQSEDIGHKRAVITWQKLLAVGASLAAVIALALWLNHKQPPTAIDSKDVPAPVAINELLSSGEITSKNPDSPLGESRGIKRSWTTFNGNVVISISTGITVFLDSYSSMSIDFISDQAIRLKLKSGKILASVNPNRKGPVFQIDTREGLISVTGTVFTASVNGDKVQVSVARGEVKIRDDSLGTSSLPAGKSKLFGTEDMFDTPSEEQVATWETLSTIDLLSSERGGFLTVSSTPNGAIVETQGKILGITPLKAFFPEGTLELKISKKGFTSFKERLRIDDGHEITRTLFLEELAQKSEEVLEDASEQDSMVVADKADRQPPQKPSELLDKARKLRKEGDWSAAATVYGDLIRRHPSSIEGKNALISLGNLELNHLGRPEKALKHYDHYLKGGFKNTLSQEAAIGKAKALRALKRDEEEVGALRDYIEFFPNSLEAPDVRKRLQELE